jgi:hypothetical protein
MKLSINVTRFDYPGGPDALRHHLKRSPKRSTALASTPCGWAIT